MIKKGIDVSHHQGTIDWNKVKPNIDFAMIRACYGWDNDKQIDKQFKINAQACENLSIPYGLFHYSYAMNESDALKEANFFLKVIEGFHPSYPIAFDFEEKDQLRLPVENQIKIIETFLNRIQEAGYYGVLYMSASPMQYLYNHKPDRINKYDCWVAHVGVPKPTFSGNYGMWQYSWVGNIDGINGNVDLDYSYKDYESLIDYKEPIINNKDNISNIFNDFVEEINSVIDKYRDIIK